MAGAQREETRARLAGRGAASARRRVWGLALSASLVTTGLALRSPADPAPSDLRPATTANGTPPAERKPSARPRARNRKTKRAIAKPDTPAPVAPAPFVPAAAPTPVAPPEKLVTPLLPRSLEPVPARATAPGSEQPALVRPPADAGARDLAPALEARRAAPEPPDAGIRADAPGSDAEPGANALPDASSEAPALPPAAAAAGPSSQPTVAEPTSPRADAPQAAVRSRHAAARAAQGTTPPRAPTAPPEDGPAITTLDLELLDKIRLEIKSRLPYFQACADAARRRGSPDIRRVQATWCVAADGVITELRLDGVQDPRLATCITRMGNRPFAVKPGVELTIPTPIVFVR